MDCRLVGCRRQRILTSRDRLHARFGPTPRHERGPCADASASLHLRSNRSSGSASCSFAFAVGCFLLIGLDAFGFACAAIQSQHGESASLRPTLRSR
jgi:hypothetical protein